MQLGLIISRLWYFHAMQIQPEELDSIMKQIDTDNSGQVDFDEFLQVTRLHAHCLTSMSSQGVGPIISRPGLERAA